MLSIILSTYCVTICVSCLIVLITKIGDGRSTINGLLKSFPFCVWQTAKLGCRRYGGFWYHLFMTTSAPFIFGTEVVLFVFLSVIYFPLKFVYWMLS